MGRPLSILLPLLLAFLPACALDLGDSPFYCCKTCNPQCPGGYECKGSSPTFNGYCVREGECPDNVPGCKAGGNCGNGTCDTGETCQSCPADCKTGCQAKCGNGTCETGETPASCPADCSGGTCNNNGTCDAGETASSCPADCKSGTCNNNGTCDAGENATNCPADCGGGSCTGNATQCVDTTTLKYCESGTWKTGTCDSLCKQGGFDYAVSCEKDTTTNTDKCMCGKYGTFGDLCDDKTIKCGTGLFCGSFSGATIGYCSKNCSSNAGCMGGPAGAVAECNLDDGKGGMACGFICDYYTQCPTGMTCDSISSLCKPNSP